MSRLEDADKKLCDALLNLESVVESLQKQPAERAASDSDVAYLTAEITLIENRLAEAMKLILDTEEAAINRASE